MDLPTRGRRSGRQLGGWRSPLNAIRHRRTPNKRRAVQRNADDIPVDAGERIYAATTGRLLETRGALRRTPT